MTLIRPHQKGRSAAQRNSPSPLYIIPLRYRRALPSGIGSQADRRKPPLAELNDRNRAVLAVLVERGPCAPRVIGDLLGLSRGAVGNDLRKLQGRGLAIRTDAGWRASAAPEDLNRSQPKGAA